MLDAPCRRQPVIASLCRDSRCICAGEPAQCTQCPGKDCASESTSHSSLSNCADARLSPPTGGLAELGPSGLLQSGRSRASLTSWLHGRAELGPIGLLWSGCSLQRRLGSWGVPAELGPCDRLQSGGLRTPPSLFLLSDRAEHGPFGFLKSCGSLESRIGAWRRLTLVEASS